MKRARSHFEELCPLRFHERKVDMKNKDNLRPRFPHVEYAIGRLIEIKLQGINQYGVPISGSKLLLRSAKAIDLGDSDDGLMAPESVKEDPVSGFVPCFKPKC